MLLRLTAIIALGLLLSQKSKAANACFDVFELKENSFSSFTELHIETNQQKTGPGKNTVSGYTIFMGKNNASGTTETIGLLNYTIKNNLLTFQRNFDNPKHHGQNVFRTLVENIIAKNMEQGILVKKIAINLSGDFYTQFQKDLVTFEGNTVLAIQASPVYQQLAPLQYSKIEWSTELSNPQQTFLRVILSSDLQN